ncbi:MAG: tripartite tricarboxylate transporter TctB family protein [Candidatus Binatia bacterium]
MKFKPEILVSLGFVVFFGGAVYLARGWILHARLFPWSIGIPGLILSIVQVWRDSSGWLEKSPERGKGVQVDEVYQRTLPARVELARTLCLFGWMLGIILAIWLLGFDKAIPVFVFLYTRFQAREGWVLSLGMTAGTVAFVWGLFDYLLGLQWSPGVLFQ